MDSRAFNSMQDFGYNRFNRNHAVLGSYNAGIVYPLGCFDVPMGATISNDLDLFARSSALGDPSFLDADVSVGHYFVSYEAMDHFFRKRCQLFKGSLADQQLFTLSIPSGTSLAVLKTILGSGTLADHLGFGVDDSAPATGNTTVDINIPFGPFLAYQMIIDRFFRNSRLQNVERTKDAIWEMFPSPEIVTCSFQHSSISKNELLMLRYANFEPDYFTTARAEAGGTPIKIPGFDLLTSSVVASGESVPSYPSENYEDLLKELENANIHNLLDRMLLQKVADMLERGGYSYNDFGRILYHVTPSDESAEYPVFLGGASAPLQVSPVVNQTAMAEPDPSTALGSQAGNVSAYLRSDDGFTRRFDRAGLYIPCMWIRPQTYYQSGLSPVWFQKTLGSKLIPQLADMQDAPIYTCELAASLASVDQLYGNPGVFGYKDRYQEYRTTPNRVVGEMRSQRVGWYIPRGIRSMVISDDFLLQDHIKYTPWVVTDNKVDHFFVRVHHRLSNTVPLPAVSRPYVW